ncbi:hypothetical protein ACFWUQ_13920 [Streptomyces sp. NPDC058662]|uniref:hypothetical protein n=1 Tax=Streptomyces sp. NPDC058662 TaxID=3346583 RepID=UPI003661E45F
MESAPLREAVSDGASVVYVHGIGNKVRRELLKSQWDRALFGADLGPVSRMAYWAPLRYPAPLPDGAADLPSGDEEIPDTAAPTPEEFIEETLREVRREAGGPRPEGAADRAGEEELAHWLARMAYAAETLERGERAVSASPAPPAPAPASTPPAPASPPAGSADPYLAEALPLPAFLRSPVFRLLVKRTFADVHAYFFGGAGEAMREVVRAELAGSGGGGPGGRSAPLVVVGHSLGSVVAYEVLRERRRDVGLFVTAGSPLGISEIKDRLALPAAVPEGVAAWCNVSDLRDLVALDHWLRPDYRPPERVTDHLVANRGAHHHGIDEYLACAPVRGAVRAVLGRLAGGGTR